MVDDIVRQGWLAEMPVDRIARNAGIPPHEVGSRVMSLGLPARDHHRRIIEGSAIAPLPHLPSDELVNERRLAEALLVDP
jgi:hypothetical protein